MLLIFMHMMWERLALIYAILLPPLLLLVLIGLMAIEGNYVHSIRSIFFDLPAPVTEHVQHAGGG